MPSYDRNRQAVRYIELIIALSTKGYRTCEIAKKFQMHRKTALRDIQALERIGVMVYQDTEMRGDNVPVQVWKVDPHWMKRFM